MVMFDRQGIEGMIFFGAVFLYAVVVDNKTFGRSTRPSDAFFSLDIPASCEVVPDGYCKVG